MVTFNSDNVGSPGVLIMCYFKSWCGHNECVYIVKIHQSTDLFALLLYYTSIKVLQKMKNFS